jgi:hypothetical protein
MSLSATAVIQAAPNAISMVTNATMAMTHESRLSIEADGECNIERNPGWHSLLHGAQNLTTCARRLAALMLRCAKMRKTAPAGHFLLPRMPETKLTAGPCGASLIGDRGLCVPLRQVI